MGSEIQVTALDHVAVNITDVERAKYFYGKVLQLQELPRPASFDFPGAWYQAGDKVIHLLGANGLMSSVRAIFA